ncbi:hypothetical protein SAMN05428989_1975 [Pseudoxanthomonas sp. GM95]|uniref:hypothetical protein n=1 Tax=Pseudoxanthomonas sp. GM95 TaxID=1881043 RepID=UPI0008C4E85E|nr:hypothetical protein [Pseudoxanthomonas sp. GM95]SEL57973.1 hypothetical protein SAMN05428989_1975 [Pseudoxanthomonas sp. GM95]
MGLRAEPDNDNSSSIEKMIRKAWAEHGRSEAFRTEALQLKAHAISEAAPAQRPMVNFQIDAILWDLPGMTALFYFHLQ